MLKIEEVTLINGERADQMNLNSFLSLIKKEQEFMDSVNILSKGCLTGIKVKADCKRNIKQLEKLLDIK